MNPTTGNTPHSSDAANHLIWQGQPIPCVVRAAVYEKGLAAGIGIKATNPALLQRFLADPDRYQLFRQLLRRQTDAELAHQGVTTGIDEEQLQEAIDEFVDTAASGGDEMVSRQVASGQAAGEGLDGCLEYAYNPSGLPLRMLGRAEQLQEARKVHRVKEGEVLVRHQPPEKGLVGRTVKGQTIPATREPRDVPIQTAAGANTRVEGERVVAEIDGVYREELSGEVRVVQELEMHEVNATTGDLPDAGIADVNVLVHRGIAGGAGVLTTENAFVGSRDEPAMIEDGTRVRARNLSVCGQVSGGQLPEPYLTGALDALDPEEQAQIGRELERGQVQVDEVCALRDVGARNVRAGTILVQSHAHNAALEAADDIRIDGDLVGGMTICGGGVRVAADLGNREGTATRIQINTEAREAYQTQRSRNQLVETRMRQADCVKALQEHLDSVQARGEKSPYWASLLEDETRPPGKPMEKQLLAEFLKAKKETQRLETAVRDAQRGVWDLEELIENVEEEAIPQEIDFAITVGGTIYPGVRVELVRAVGPEDLDRPVKNRAGMDTAIQLVRNRLADQVEHHVELYRDAVEERRQALEEMYRDRESRPEMPEIPNKCFEEYVLFPGAAGADTRPGMEAVQEGVVSVYAHDPNRFFLKKTTRITAPVENATIRVEQEGGDFVLKCLPNDGKVKPWQQDEEALQKLEEVWILGQSARTHLLGKSTRGEAGK